MKNLLCALAILMVSGLASAWASSYTLTKYDDQNFARFCYGAVIANHNENHNHFDGAVTVGDWGLCGFSDRVDPIGPGTIFHNSALYKRSGNGWTFSQKGNGYFNVLGLEAAGVPPSIAQQLAEKFRSDVCFRGDVPGTKWYCKSQ